MCEDGSDEKFRILVLYQGEYGRSLACRVRKAFRSEHAPKILDRSVVAFTLDEKERRNLEDWMDRLINHVETGTFDVALALLTPDPRSASDGAGNVGLEVGWILGYEGDHRLIVVKIDELPNGNGSEREIEVDKFGTLAGIRPDPRNSDSEDVVDRIVLEVKSIVEIRASRDP